MTWSMRNGIDCRRQWWYVASGAGSVAVRPGRAGRRRPVSRPRAGRRRGRTRGASHQWGVEVAGEHERPLTGPLLQPRCGLVNLVDVVVRPALLPHRPERHEGEGRRSVDEHRQGPRRAVAMSGCSRTVHGSHTTTARRFTSSRPTGRLSPVPCAHGATGHESSCCASAMTATSIRRSSRWAGCRRTSGSSSRWRDALAHQGRRISTEPRIPATTSWQRVALPPLCRSHAAGHSESMKPRN
jgi:hypothetical protein